MLPPVEDLKAAIEHGVPGTTVTLDGGCLFIQPQQLVAVCRFLKSAPEFQMDHVSNLTAIDYPPDRLDAVYHLFSMAKKHGPIPIKVTLPRANPRVPSVVPIYRGAEFQEREAYDLYGVIFEGHPDLRRILMWDEFKGHPMRKDYVPEDQDVSG